MSYKVFKQVISSGIFRYGWSRRLLLNLRCLPSRMLGPEWAGARQWSEQGEDVCLLKLAQPYLQSGFYVDVGANMPTKRSNTFRLYCHGMRGICIEPNLELASLYERVRPQDEIVCAAIGSRAGVEHMYRFNYHVYSTCSELEGERRIKSANPKMRTELLRKSLVPMIPLKSLLKKARERFEGTFFLLKTDTEGFDLEVLLSNDWSHARPMYVLSESTGAQDDVKGFLEEKGYRLLERFSANQLFESVEKSNEG